MNTFPLVSNNAQASVTDAPDDGQYITVVHDRMQPLAKTYTLNSDGTVDKKSAANSSVLIAKTIRVTTHKQLAEVLIVVSENTHAALMNSYVPGTEDGREFLFLSAMEIESRLGIPANSRNKQKGIHQVTINDQPWLAYGRFKDNLQPSVWQIADRDNDAHTPEMYGRMTFAEWIIEVAKILPGFNDTSFVMTTSVSGRVLQDGQPVGSGNGHVWFKVANPDDIERLRAAILVRALQLDLTWPKPRYSKSSPGTVVGSGVATILDPSVYSVARLVFEGKPTVFGGLTVAPQSIIVHKGAQDTLDTQAATLPDSETVRKLTQANGVEMSISRGSTGLTTTAYNLTLDTEIDTKTFGVIAVRTYLSMETKDKLRCQAPYRESSSYAAFLSLDAQGNPFVYDSGTNTTHRLEGTEPEAFERCEFVEIDPVAGTRTTHRLDGTRCVETELSFVSTAVKHTTNGCVAENPLVKYSLRGKSGDLEKSVTKQEFLLGDIALMGQLWVVYAAPNTGKTLIVIYLLLEAIRQGRVDGSMVFYINVDDNRDGLLEKLHLAEEAGFHMLADGHQGFSVKLFVGLIEEMIKDDKAAGVVIILDTMKKFTNLMDKSSSSEFAQLCRRFVMKGGTVIALAHTNKRPDAEGKPIYAGTSDIVDDFDCAYTLSAVQSPTTDSRVVAFKNIKRRGGVVEQAAYSYSTESGISYGELLCSVLAVDDTEFKHLKQVEDTKPDSEIIAAVKVCISAGVNSKMILVDAVAQRIGVSKGIAIKVLEKYTGVDAAVHHWTYAVMARGAKVYSILDSVPEGS